MTDNIRYTHTGKPAAPFVIGGLVAVIGVCSLAYLGVQSSSDNNVDASRVPQTLNPVGGRHAPQTAHAKMSGSEFSDFIDADSDKPFGPSEVQHRLQDFFDRWDQGHAMSQAQQKIFMARLLNTIDSSPEARKAVADYYAKIPAKDAANREIIQNMIVRSESGRKMMVDEASRIWKSKDSSLYTAMYKTYSNFPGTASRETLSEAMSTLNSHASDVPTSVAALNFIGTIEEDTSKDAMSLRRNAISQLNSVATGNGDDVVKALAAQKVYRLSAPDAAADAAVDYLRGGATEPLVRQTLNAIASGEVELTPPLKSTLLTAVARPSASPQEREMLESLLQGHS
ncbi:hypothetical protein VC279_12105 [Xanthomonas sp. WHRI 10064A]|uniref:hypothetical protein n=1 Tax=unclassified Xanthomonas TaxID=2643310 RepID=UPI002B232369|nr:MULTISPECIES: hypothetical protein [unclassified Xanthomonas]MEA9587706.1 hypothetical protein [Xanthomonas sp. WHRI 10064B]MEA9615428.1 hypothetical protein [Xanthomonas sp. WHRI 10064A]